MDAKTRQAIEARIEKAEPIRDAIDEETGGDSPLAEKVRAVIVSDILFELLESLAEGDSLEQAIEGIHSNF